MKNAFLISYDISDDKRRYHVHKALQGWGERLQYSVWRCELTPTARAQMQASLHPLIHQREDQILIIDLGPCRGRGEQCIVALGKAYAPPKRDAFIF